ncbi:hypothetical protein HDV00_009094 [Rhizophlyctis rosea]|nr:hypothetical protein HDV00_009094 [Rhizophlyctis rosea]
MATSTRVNGVAKGANSRGMNEEDPTPPPDVSLPVKPGGVERFLEILEEAEIESGFNGNPQAIPPVLLKKKSTIEAMDHLSQDQEERLTFQINDLYQNLQPSSDSSDIRSHFLAKIQRILDTEWPGKRIVAHLFGSSVNGLGTIQSDVDICLTTPWDDRVQGVANMHVLASALRKHGMQKIYTVAKAKVPICKFYDPDLVNCDINVNNTIALRNTQMIKMYVEIDPRVRPLMMVIKHWTRRRVLNDAAKGGTLSSYCWVMMVLNFLQMRQPPILPCLHEMYFARLRRDENVERLVVDGVDCSFHDDINTVRGFGVRNHETLGTLFYAFFRRYAVEFDYEKNVVSVRHGRYLTKEEKGWNVDVERMCRFLCVEEPFNPQRNLANSADGVSVAGMRKEFERALDRLAKGASLEEVCEQYRFPQYSHRGSYGGMGAGGGGGGGGGGYHHPRPSTNGMPMPKMRPQMYSGWTGQGPRGFGEQQPQQQQQHQQQQFAPYNGHDAPRIPYGYGYQTNGRPPNTGYFFNGVAQHPPSVADRPFGMPSPGIEFGERLGASMSPVLNGFRSPSMTGEDDRRRDIAERAGFGSRVRSVSSDGARPRSMSAQGVQSEGRKNRPPLPNIATARQRNSPNVTPTGTPVPPEVGAKGSEQEPSVPTVKPVPREGVGMILKGKGPDEGGIVDEAELKSPQPVSPLVVTIVKHRQNGPDLVTEKDIRRKAHPADEQIIKKESHTADAHSAKREPHPADGRNVRREVHSVGGPSTRRESHSAEGQSKGYPLAQHEQHAGDRQVEEHTVTKDMVTPHGCKVQINIASPPLTPARPPDSVRQGNGDKRPQMPQSSGHRKDFHGRGRGGYRRDQNSKQFADKGVTQVLRKEFPSADGEDVHRQRQPRAPPNDSGPSDSTHTESKALSQLGTPVGSAEQRRREASNAPSLSTEATPAMSERSRSSRSASPTPCPTPAEMSLETTQTANPQYASKPANYPAPITTLQQQPSQPQPPHQPQSQQQQPSSTASPSPALTSSSLTIITTQPVSTSPSPTTTTAPSITSSTTDPSPTSPHPPHAPSSSTSSSQQPPSSSKARNRRNSKGVMVWANHSQRQNSSGSVGGAGGDAAAVKKPLLDGLFETPVQRRRRDREERERERERAREAESMGGGGGEREGSESGSVVSEEGGRRRGSEASVSSGSTTSYGGRGRARGMDERRGSVGNDRNSAAAGEAAAKQRSSSAAPAPAKIAWQGMGMRRTKRSADDVSGGAGAGGGVDEGPRPPRLGVMAEPVVAWGRGRGRGGMGGGDGGRKEGR